MRSEFVPGESKRSALTAGCQGECVTFTLELSLLQNKKYAEAEIT